MIAFDSVDYMLYVFVPLLAFCFKLETSILGYMNVTSKLLVFVKCFYATVGLLSCSIDSQKRASTDSTKETLKNHVDYIPYTLATP